jgi:hypothetical protein
MFWGTMCDKKIPALKKFLKTMFLNMRQRDIIITSLMKTAFLKIG